MQQVIKIKYLNEKCKLIKGTSGAFAFDVIANISEPITVKKGEMVSIPLGFAVDTGASTIGVLMFMRSGLAFKHGLMLVNSVAIIDSDYRAELQAGIWNTGRVDDYTIVPNERIGQVAFMQSVDVLLDEVDELSNTARGVGGFGSSGRQIEDVVKNLIEGPKCDYPEASPVKESEGKTVGEVVANFLTADDSVDVSEVIK